MLFACWLGVLKAGGIVVATMPILRSGDIATVLERARISHAIVDARCLADYTPAADKIGLVSSLLTYAADSGTDELEKRLEEVALGVTPIYPYRYNVTPIASTPAHPANPQTAVHP